MTWFDLYISQVYSHGGTMWVVEKHEVFDINIDSGSCTDELTESILYCFRVNAFAFTIGYK